MLQKTKILQEEDLKINIRVNEDTYYEVDLMEISKREVIYHLKSKFFRNELEQNNTVKFIYLGKILNDNQLISDIKFQNGQIIQAYIIEPKPEEQDEELQTQQQIQRNHADDQNVNIELILQEILNQQDEGSNLEMISGFIVGLIFGIVAILIQCAVPCSVKARQGVILGFISQIIFFQIRLMYQTRGSA